MTLELLYGQFSSQYNYRVINYYHKVLYKIDHRSLLENSFTWLMFASFGSAMFQGKRQGIVYIDDIIRMIMVAAIAPWFRLRLPSCGPRFESQAHHLRFFQFILKL